VRSGIMHISSVFPSIRKDMWKKLAEYHEMVKKAAGKDLRIENAMSNTKNTVDSEGYER
jgi:hypothetical protein